MKKAIISLALMVLLTSQSMQADASNSEIQVLREQIQALTQRLDELEKTNQRQVLAAGQNWDETAAVMAQANEKMAAVSEQVNDRLNAVSWAERLRWSGDFRFRYENIQVGGLDRDRFRIRARSVLAAKVSDTVQVGLGFASGGEDPVSTNQTLGGGGSTKDLKLDLAYFDWRGLANTRVVGGKVQNILYRPFKWGLQWDGDWRPEGAGFIWDNGTFFTDALGSWLESDTKKSQEFAWVVQAGGTFKLGNSARLTIGATYTNIDTAGAGSVFGDDDDFFGNSFDPDSLTYIYDYHVVEAFADAGFNLFGLPARAFVDFVQNRDADEFDTGYAIGMQLGAARAKGTWDVSYVYQDLEADAVFGLLADSDFGGGGTDARGSVIKGTYAIDKGWTAQFTYFINKIDENLGTEKDFDRLQLDLNFKY